jgi:superfamily II DNA or RNA helicase
MKEIFKELDALRETKESIRDIISEVERLRLSIDNDKDLESFVNVVRYIVQEEAMYAIVDNGGRGMVVLPTGSGKSKVAIELSKYYLEDKTTLIVPTEKLRDENWKEEFIKWGAETHYNYLDRLCYASAYKTKDKNIKFLILDEAHNITELSSEFFFNNKVEKVIALTATKSTDQTKLKIFQDLNIPIVYELSLDDAVRLGFVAPYKIKVILTTLNNVDKDVLGGTKKAPFITTESAMYNYLNGTVEKAKIMNSPKGKMILKFAIMKRMHFIHKLKSKHTVTKFILDNLIPEEDRAIIFAANIENSEAFGPDFFHSKSTSKAYEAFKNEEINRLYCVKSVNEGHNFPSVDKGVIEQIDSNDKNLTQRVGRIIRFRPGHEALLYIIVAEGTQDAVWAEKALANVDKSKVEYIRFTSLKDQFENGNN